jgi:predicted amidohydrolase YtcJ
VSRCQALVNASIYLGRGRTLDRGFIVFRDGCIEAVGSARDFDLARPPDTQTAYLGGHLVLPGFVDAHLHLVHYARSLFEPDLAATRSLEEGLAAIRALAAGQPRGTWITGRGWDKQSWGLDGFPTRHMLDQVAPDNPVSLTSRDGHLAWVNSAGLHELGLAETPLAVDGGETVVDGSGRPTGIFKENAATLVWARLGSRDEDRLIDALPRAAARLRQMGLTAVHTLDDKRSSAVLTRALGRGPLEIRVERIQEVLEPGDLEGLEPAPGASLVKTYADGTLGSQTASMLAPYLGQPGNVGIAALSPAKLRAIVFGALARGFGVCVHAIGDRAAREVLDVYEEARREPAYCEIPLRLEHAQVLDPADIPRFARLGVVASMQPIHLVGDRHVAERYWGGRSAAAYAWKRILDAGGRVVFGSDAPIESPDPLRGLHAAVTRTDPAKPEEGPWYPAERLEAWRGVDCYTESRIAVGERAEFTILDRNILDPAAPGAILDARVVETVVAPLPRCS